MIRTTTAAFQLLVPLVLMLTSLDKQPDAAALALEESVQQPRVYGREFLLSLQHMVTPEPSLLDHVPAELVWGQGNQRRPRRQGRRGGIHHRLRRRHNRPPLPSILLSNARSLRKKFDELRINIRACHEYRESCLLIYTESWLQDDFPDELSQIQGFTTVRMDRNMDSGKTRGGGICVYMNDSWCTNYSVKCKVCTPDLELLCLSLWPFYFPRDYGNIFVCVVYVPPSGKASKAATIIADCVHLQLQTKPDAPLFVLGDLNHCKLEQALPGFYQYIKSGTRKNNILDKCYGKITDGYVAKIRPPLSTTIRSF